MVELDKHLDNKNRCVLQVYNSLIIIIIIVIFQNFRFLQYLSHKIKSHPMKHNASRLPEHFNRIDIAFVSATVSIIVSNRKRGRAHVNIDLHRPIKL